MSLSLEDVNDVLSKEIEVASDSGKLSGKGVRENSRKLTYCPLAKRFQLYMNGTALWPSGERNVIYAIKRYNDLDMG